MCIGSAHLCKIFDAGRGLRYDTVTIYVTAIIHLLKPMIFINILSDELIFTTIIPVIRDKLQKMYILVI